MHGDHSEDDVSKTVVVWQAQGVLMARYGVSAQEALKLLIQQVRSADGHVVEVCRKIVDEASRGL